jgi:AbrB family looped-hinge helix DNA binding protein
MDAHGRVLVPLTMRYKLNLNSGDRLAVDQLGDGTILLKKLAAGTEHRQSNKNGQNEKS